MNNQLKQWLLPVLSGVFIGTSYIPFPPWASLFCFVPLWLFWLQQNSLKRVLIGSFITAFIFTLIGFNWMAHLLHEFAHLPWAVAVFGLFIYGLIAHLFVPLAGVLWFWVQYKCQCSARLSLYLMAIITVLCEAYSFTLFDWNFGYSWYGSGVPVYHWAEFVGFSGLSALTLLTNLPLLLAWQQRKQISGKIIAGSVLLIFMLLNVGGLGLQARLAEPDSKLHVLMIQASIENSEKLAAELGKGFSNEILHRYLTQTDAAFNRYKDRHIDFVMWPETAFPALLGEPFKNDPAPSVLAEFLRERQLPLITGAYSVDETQRLMTNSLFVLNKEGDVVPPHYSKSILLAFGEYIPGEQWFPKIRDFLPTTGHFARGHGATELLTLNDYKMGAQICYESLFPKFSRDLANLGAQFIVNVTNDSWYGSWQEPYQHFYMTLARGVEFRRPVLRVTNTGISAVSLASGEILEQSPIHQSWAGWYEVPYLKNPPSTFYQDWFWLVPSLLWGALLVLLGLGIKTR
jgi:apolipoprotein N-acyltransferase